MERRGTRAERFVTRIDAKSVIGSYPGDRQAVDAINDYVFNTGDFPNELLAFLDGRVDAIPDDAAAPRGRAVVRVGDDLYALHRPYDSQRKGQFPASA